MCTLSGRVVCAQLSGREVGMDPPPREENLLHSGVQALALLQEAEFRKLLKKVNFATDGCGSQGAMN